jgi:hypothetical protein
MQEARSTRPNRDSPKKAAQYILTGGVTAAIIVGCCACPAYVLEDRGSGTLAYLYIAIALIIGATIGYVGNRLRRRLFFVVVGAGLGTITGLLLAVFASVIIIGKNVPLDLLLSLIPTSAILSILIGTVAGIMTGCLVVLPDFQVSPQDVSNLE